MGQLKLQGSLIISPQVVTDGAFPGAVSSVSLSATPNPKSSQVDSGIKTRVVGSANAFVALSGVGPSDDVTQGDTLYIKSNASFSVELTFVQPNLAPDLVQVVPLNGTLVMEFPADQYLKGIRVKGVGIVEYCISGQS